MKVDAPDGNFGANGDMFLGLKVFDAANLSMTQTEICQLLVVPNRKVT